MPPKTRLHCYQSFKGHKNKNWPIRSSFYKGPECKYGDLFLTFLLNCEFNALAFWVFPRCDQTLVLQCGMPYQTITWIRLTKQRVQNLEEMRLMLTFPGLLPSLLPPEVQTIRHIFIT